jgi:hypothetical protein
VNPLCCQFALCLLLLSEAIKRNPLTSNSTESDFQHEVVRFLRGAGDRNGGRKQRALKKAAKGGPFKGKGKQPSASNRRMLSDSDSDDVL